MPPSTLPRNLELRESVPSRYQFTCDYFHLDPLGKLRSKQRIRADYTRGMPVGKARWNEVCVSTARDFDEPFLGPKRQEFMEGFAYPLSTKEELFDAEFFKNWPDSSPLVPLLRNLVWDVFMIERFAHDFFDKLQLNVPLKTDSGDVPLAGEGTFTNRGVDLTWVGVSRMNGEACALLRYRAFFNQFEMEALSHPLRGRSHYWGEIWVSIEDKQVEYATLYEDVMIELPKPTGLSGVFRIGVFEKRP